MRAKNAPNIDMSDASSNLMGLQIIYSLSKPTYTDLHAQTYQTYHCNCASDRITTTVKYVCNTCTYNSL